MNSETITTNNFELRTIRTYVQNKKNNPITNHSKHASLLALVFTFHVLSWLELSFLVLDVIAFAGLSTSRLQIWRISLPRPALKKRLTEASHQGQIYGFSRTFNSTRNNAKHFKFSSREVESTTNGKLRQLFGRLHT